MRATRYLIPLLIVGTLSAAEPKPADPTMFPNLAKPVEVKDFERPVATVTQERMTVTELTDFMNTLDRGAPVRLIYRNGAEYAGSYSGGVTGQSAILCRQGMSSPEWVPLDAVTDAYVFVSGEHLVRIKRLDEKEK